MNIEISKSQKEVPIEEKSIDVSSITIGKDILELLSSSMYVNPLTIYREYIQNSADAIDDAVKKKVLRNSKDGQINVYVDYNLRKVRIVDNGIGIPNNSFISTLTSIGASKKWGTGSRGFRGVGRLAGIGYCQELIFRSRAKKDEPVMEITWDCKILSKLLSDPTYKGGIRKLINDVITVKETKNTDAPDHFFEVELHKPRRIGRDILLNEQLIGEYLAQVAPVPISEEFSLKSEIANLFKKNDFDLPNYSISINEQQSIVRPFRNGIDFSMVERCDFGELEEIIIYGTESDSEEKSEVIAIGWIAHHDYHGAIPKIAGIRGLRARVGNMQVGEEDLFLKIFPEDRFNSWTVGEIHILDRRIKPNGRRDAFEYNSQLVQLEAELLPIGSKITRMCRQSSIMRNRIKSIRKNLSFIIESTEIILQGALTKKQILSIDIEVKSKLEKIKSYLENDEIDQKMEEISEREIKDIEQKYNSALKKLEKKDVLGSLKPAEKKIYQKVFELIYEFSSDREYAKKLIDKIISNLS